MKITDLPDSYSEAVKVISENRNKMTEGRRNKLTIELITREILKRFTEFIKPSDK